MQLSELFPGVPSTPDDDVTLELAYRPHLGKYQVTVAGKNGIHRGGFDFFDDAYEGAEYAASQLSHAMGLKELYVDALVAAVFDPIFAMIEADEMMMRYAR